MPKSDRSRPIDAPAGRQAGHLAVADAGSDLHTRPRALITGASSGVGAAIARELVGAGMEVLGVGRNAGRLQFAGNASDWPPGAGQYVPIVADLAVPEDLEWIVTSLRAKSLDVLVHAAGVYLPGSAKDLPPDVADALYQVNVGAPATLTSALADALARAAGQVVFVNSSIALKLPPDLGAYAESKRALRDLADSSRSVLNRRGVRVVTLFLGRTATPMQAAVHASERKAYWPERLIQPHDVAMLVSALLTLPRTVEVTEVRLRPSQRP